MSLLSRSFSPELQTSSRFEWRVPLSAPSFTEQEVQAVSDTLRSGWWTYGPIARQLESDFAELLGVRHAIAVSSGTAALHLAHLALGLAQGDEVITPSLNFVAGANTILHAGGIPHFCDVASLKNPLVTAETLRRALTAEARAICLVHYGGYPCPMDEIMDFARAHGLWVIEDVAHAPGASWKGIPCGAWGDISCFSFFGNKNLTCGEGGMIVTRRDDLAEKVRNLRSHGMTSLTWDRFLGHRFSYDVTAAGFNYRIDDLRAALLEVQLRSLDRLNRLRRERVEWYRECLGRDPHWMVPFEDCEGASSHHLLTIVLGERVPRDRVMTFMRTRGIQTSVHYPPVHQFAFYRKLCPPLSDLNMTEALGRRLLTLPLFPDMRREQVDLVCDSLREAVAF